MQKVAAVLTAAAVLDLFPDVLLVEGGGSAYNFYYDFVFPFHFESHHLTLVEERVRSFLKKKINTKTLEMIPSNAAEFLLHLGQPLRADIAKECTAPLLELVQIGQFVDICPLPHQIEIGAIALRAVVDFGGEKQRIEGVAAVDKEGLKNLIKQLQSYEKENHIAIGSREKLFELVEGEGCVWYPRGQKLRQQLVDLWEEEHRDIARVVRGFSDAPPLPLLKKIPCIAEWVLESNSGEIEGLLNPKWSTSDRVYIRCSKDKALSESISSLQFMAKISKILHFETSFVVPPSYGRDEGTSLLVRALNECGSVYSENGEGTGVVMRTFDRLGRAWTLASLRVIMKPKENEVFFIRSSFGSLERVIALLLEMQQEVQL